VVGEYLGWRQFLNLDDEALFGQCRVDRFRASGPGGQKRNVTDSAVRLRHLPSGLIVEANDSRSQHQNRTRAVRKLRHAIALTLREPVILNSGEPSAELIEARSSERRLEMGRRDTRYLTVIAALFDVLAAVDWRPGDAARQIGVSSASLTRLIQRDRPAWRALNEQRRVKGMSALRAH
jgi:hypothetical protein